MNEDYSEARRIGIKERRKAVLGRKAGYLCSLDKKVKNLLSLPVVDVGRHEIPLSMVVGTRNEDRRKSFSAGFMPLMDEDSEFASKWQNLYQAQLEEGIRDPIRVFEYRRQFYVAEGNKRVSVLKYLKTPSVMADISRIMPERTNDPETRAYYEFLDYYRVAPIYEIGFSLPGEYEKLAELVGENLVKKWPAEKVKQVRAAFVYFEKVLREDKKSMRLTPGESFLVYLAVYPLKSLVEESDTTIRLRIHKLYREMLTETGRQTITVSDFKDIYSNSGSSFLTARQVFGRQFYSREAPLRVAFIYTKNKENSRWIYGHELGRLALEQNFSGLVETKAFENCENDEKLRRAIDAAASAGYEMIVTTSPVQAAETLRSAIHYPAIRFMNCSLNIFHNAVRSYYGRMFEAKFILGALAASILSENHEIAYVADYPIYGSISNINAFAIGAELADPWVKIRLYWGAEKNVNWREDVRKRKINIISGPDNIRPEDASREYGVYVQGADGELQNVGFPVCDWGRYYTLIARSVLDGSWNAESVSSDERATCYWLGMSDGVIDLILSRHLPFTVRKAVDYLKKMIARGELDPFAGPIHAQDRAILKGADRALKQEEIVDMDWLNHNVIGRIPAMRDLKEEAKDTVEVSGVLKEKGE